MLRYENEDENEDYYKRQQGTTKNNFIEVSLANLLNWSKKKFWQICQNVFLLLFSRFAKLTSIKLCFVVPCCLL